MEKNDQQRFNFEIFNKVLDHILEQRESEIDLGQLSVSNCTALFKAIDDAILETISKED